VRVAFRRALRSSTLPTVLVSWGVGLLCRRIRSWLRYIANGSNVANRGLREARALFVTGQWLRIAR
jgi:hypothetical protein